MKKTKPDSSLRKPSPRAMLTISYFYAKASKYRFLFLLSFVFIPLAQRADTITPRASKGTR